MTLRCFSMTRARLLGTLTATAAVACLVPAAAAQAAVSAPAAPAARAQAAQPAALSSADWAQAMLPANYYVSDTPVPVSCVPGAKLCVALPLDSAVILPSFRVGQAAAVSTNAGKSWTGYATLPTGLTLTGLSCVSSTVCWASGTGPAGEPAVAETTDGAQTWANMSPASWASATWWPNSIDCVSASTCWLAGQDESHGVAPALVETTDGGNTWTQLSNLPVITQYDPNGTYQLNAISCVSASSCVAVGGLNYSDGKAVVITTADGGSSWSLSSDPTLLKSQQLFGVSCLTTAGGTVRCVAAADAPAAAGPVTLVSRDGGATWGHRQSFDTTGWFSSVSCATVSRCWVAGAGTSVALAGTLDGGTSWSTVSSDTTDQEGAVSCLNSRVCVAAVDNGLWVTQDDGGLTADAASAPGTPGAAGTLGASTASHQ